MDIDTDDLIKSLQETVVELTIALTFARARIATLSKKAEAENAEQAI
jgi:hypothetical protein